MKKNHKKFQYYSILFFAAILVFPYSCNEDFLYNEPKGVVFTESLSTEEGVNLLLIGAYSLADGAGSTAGWPGGHAYAGSIRNWVWDCASDDAYKGSSQGDFSTGGEIERYVALPTNPLLEQKWMVLYDGVSRANDVLKALVIAQENMDEPTVNILSAQARFLRAFYHFRLQKMHYQIPYITEDIENPELVENNHPVWPEIEDDLQFAIENLPESFAGEPGKATKWAAMAVKAYVHLFQQEYAEAKLLLDDIINDGGFDLAEDFYDNYNATTENNIESIFEIQSSVNDGVNLGYHGNADSWVTNPYNPYTPTCCGMYQPSQDLVNAFKVDVDGLPLLGIGGPKYNDENLENDMGILSTDEFIPTDHLLDPRLDYSVGRRGIPYLDWGIHTGNGWIRSQVNGGPYNTKKQMFSQEERDFASNSAFARATSINFRAYRFAHVLLWRAECAVEENDLETARQLVNRVRMRASDDFIMGRVSTYSFSPDTTIEVDWDQPAANYLLGEYASFPSQEYARAAVRMELRLETALEGNRFFDLRRWEIDDEVLSEFIENEVQFRVFMEGTSYNAEKNDHWPLPQNQVDIQAGILQQDPSY